MRCNNCGNEITAGSKFCVKCGMPVGPDKESISDNNRRDGTMGEHAIAHQKAVVRQKKNTNHRVNGMLPQKCIY